MSPHVDHEAAQREAGVEFDLLGVDEAGVLDGTLSGGKALRPGSVQHAPAGGGGQDLGVDGRRRESAHQFLGGGYLFPAVAAGQVLHQFGALGPEPGRALEVRTAGVGGVRGVVLGRQQPQGGLDDLEGTFAFAAEPGGDGGLGEQVEEAQRGGAGVAAAGRVGARVVHRPECGAGLRGDVVPQLHGPFQKPQLLGVGVPFAGFDGREQHGGEGTRRVVRVVPVAGEPGGPLVGGDDAGGCFQGFGVAAVEAGPFAREQIVADCLAHQGVPEAISVAVGCGEQDVGADGGAQRLDEFVLAETGDGCEQRVLDGGAALGDDPGDPLGVLGQTLDTDEQEVAKGVGQSGPAALVGGDGEFLDEEGVAVGAFEDVVDERRGRFRGEDAGHLARDLVAAEAGQFDALDGAQPVEFRDEGPQRVAAVDVVGSVGGDDDETAAAQGAQKVGEEVTGGGVGPVEVLQYEDDRTFHRHAFEQTGGQLEEPGRAVLVGPAPPAGRGLAELGQQPGQFLLLAHGRRGEFVGQLPPQGPQRGGERREGQPVRADLDAAAEGEDGALATRLVVELLDEPGLADSGLARDEQRLRLSRGGAGERMGKCGQFAGATDEHGADGPGLHAAEHRTEVRAVGGEFQGDRHVPGRSGDPGVPALTAHPALRCVYGR